MKNRFSVLGCFLIFLSALSISKTNPVKAADESLDASLGGMSLILYNYYETIISENTILFDNSNITTLLSDNPNHKSFIPDDSTIGIADTDDFIPVYESRNRSSKITGRLYSDSCAVILDFDTGFYKIVSGAVTGYVSSDYLLTGIDACKRAISLNQAYAHVISDTFLYRNHSTSVKGRLKVKNSDEFLITSFNDEWFTVQPEEPDTIYYLKRSDAQFRFYLQPGKTLKAACTDITCMFWPLPEDHSICTYYGYRKPPVAGASTFHQGLDIGGDKGLTIAASLSGTVTASCYSSSRGYYVEIDHGNNVVTRYLHCSKLLVKKGQAVTQGQAIGLVGSTGISTSPHLHFSLEINGKSVDPYPYLKRVQSIE